MPGFLDQETAGQGQRRKKEQPRMQQFLWLGARVRLHVIPPAWLLGDPQTEENGRKGNARRPRTAAEKLRRYVARAVPEGETFWLSPELTPFFPGYTSPLPEPGLAAALLRRQPFKEILVMLLDAEDWNWVRWWQEPFLEDCFFDLNGLYLVGGKEEETQPFYEWLYGQSGLVACVTPRVPETDGRRTAVVDLRFRRKPPLRELAEGSLYLDLTSQPEKQRLFKEKRRDISYISARNYLDTAFKARYNAI